MRGLLKIAACSLMLVLASEVDAVAQASQDNSAFTPENAVLNTAIPFAIGAREARQELRGSFGWPTFQEGLVEGVYFRFDPDGYARFAPTPRLDTDVFEVICRPRTISCIGRKGSLTLFLTGSGALQLSIDDAIETDRFFLVEGITELPLPPQIAMPLDIRLETLLSSGGEVVIRRGEAEIVRISLTGFPAVAAYLKWVAAQQDYSVLPRGWPIPNSSSDPANSGLTSAASWQSSFARPQAQPIFERVATAPNSPGVEAEVAEVRGEVNLLRELLIARNETPDTAAMAGSSGSDSEPVAESINPVGGSPEERIAALQSTAESLLAEIEILRSGGDVEPARELGPTYETSPTLPADASGHGELAKKLEYLMNEIGLDAQTSLMLVQSMTENDEASEPVAIPELAVNPTTDVVGDILVELRTQLENENSFVMEGTESTGALGLDASMAEVDQSPIPPEEYTLLTQYFRSVFPTNADH